MKATLIIISMMVLLGVAGHNDMKMVQMERAVATCQTLDDMTTPTFSQCIENQFEENSDK